MKVVFSDGTKGTLSQGDSKNLYLNNRFTLESWRELEFEMNQLGIIEFEDPVLSRLGGSPVSIEYVRNQINEH